MRVSYGTVAHHSSGPLFGILHDDGNLLLHISDKAVSNTRLRVQNCATDVDAEKKQYTYSTLRYWNNIFNVQHCICTWTRKEVYLAGNCSVLRFQPFAVIALDRRNISKSSEPKATTDTSGSPSTTTPLILRILPNSI